MDQNETLAAITYRASTTVGDVLGDAQNRRNWALGETTSPVHGDVAGVFPRKGSPDWNIAHLPEVVAKAVAEQGLRLTDGDSDRIVAKLVGELRLELAGIVRAELAALRAEVRDAVADLGEGGAAQVRADQG